MTLSARCYGLGYLTGLAAFAWMARRRKLATAGMMAVMGAGLLGGLVGANLAQWLFGGAAGKTVLGGIAGGYTPLSRMNRHDRHIVRPADTSSDSSFCSRSTRQPRAAASWSAHA